MDEIKMRNNTQQPKTKSTKTIFIRGLPYYTTSDDLFKLCKQYGRIQSLRLSCENTQAFVRYYKVENANTAIFYLSQLLLDSNYILTVDFAFRSHHRFSDYFRAPTNVYFENLPNSWNTRNLENLCQQYGQVVGKRILFRKESGENNYGFVRFQSHESAHTAIKSLNGSILKIIKNDDQEETELKLSVRFANRCNEKGWISSSEEEEEEEEEEDQSQNSEKSLDSEVYPRIMEKKVKKSKKSKK